jgi:hypothetical protein
MLLFVHERFANLAVDPRQANSKASSEEVTTVASVEVNLRVNGDIIAWV